ncbi:hypothetical protein HETIRDRAFT_388552 [Heterobasidion irregulare TC 32-1]|uniref:Uncharacterized protein n=1 Tax=Heterobasidion irregulare (strain TC 32-1) TaxID=747525 RepID=W4JU39_HETIT|nr:uncharacterized protein HETIRDRAFT_388552 [Heterobasidion irregulare TC 32-1]ETW76974.1 hypothetical protein HETIRDRAFT_388552 [Heterobasidion irregulare TC 32-1]
MVESVLDNFAVLDEVVQLVYRGSSRFIVLSHVKDDAWLLHVGLTQEGRWWQGRWLENDVLHFVGEKAAPELLERFSDRLLSAFTKKELSIDNWDPLSEHSQDLKLILGPGAKRPVHITLTEMTPREAATFAAGEFASIALQAQSHQCRLYPPACPQTPETHDYLKRLPTRSPRRGSSPAPFKVPERPKDRSREATPLSSLPRAQKKRRHSSSSPPPPIRQPKPSTSTSTSPSQATRSAQDQDAGKGKRKAKPLASEPIQFELLAREEIRVLRQELSKARGMNITSQGGSFGLGGSTSALQSRSVMPAQTARRGASLANPNKKARRYQAVEFASDSGEE